MIIFFKGAQVGGVCDHFLYSAQQEMMRLIKPNVLFSVRCQSKVIKMKIFVSVFLNILEDFIFLAPLKGFFECDVTKQDRIIGFVKLKKREMNLHVL